MFSASDYSIALSAGLWSALSFGKHFHCGKLEFCLCLENVCLFFKTMQKRRIFNVNPDYLLEPCKSESIYCLLGLSCNLYLMGECLHLWEMRSILRVPWDLSEANGPLKTTQNMWWLTSPGFIAVPQCLLDHGWLNDLLLNWWFLKTRLSVNCKI